MGAAARCMLSRDDIERTCDRAVIRPLRQTQRYGIQKYVGPDCHAQPNNYQADRKSVVSGKSVSVRVDLGGRRIIKTKRTRHSGDGLLNYHVTELVRQTTKD